MISISKRGVEKCHTIFLVKWDKESYNKNAIFIIKI